MKTLYAIMLVSWPLLESTIVNYLKSTDQPAEVIERRSLTTIWITLLFGIAAALILQNLHWAIMHLSDVLAYSLGFFLLFAGVALRWHSIFLLGSMFTVNLSTSPRHVLIVSGAYRYIRHPSYTGAIIALIGFGITFQNWLSLLVITSFSVTAFLYRIKVEEQFLLSVFGEKYSQYQLQTKRLMPLIY